MVVGLSVHSRQSLLIVLEPPDKSFDVSLRTPKYLGAPLNIRSLSRALALSAAHTRRTSSLWSITTCNRNKSSRKWTSESRETGSAGSSVECSGLSRCSCTRTKTISHSSALPDSHRTQMPGTRTCCIRSLGRSCHHPTPLNT